MKTLKLNENAQKYGPWSISKLDVAKQCGFRFKLKYIDGIKEPEPARPEGRIGQAAHKAMELVLRGQNIDTAFKESAKKFKLLTNDLDELHVFETHILAFADRVKKFEEKNPAQRRLIEHQFGLTENLKSTKFFGDDVFFRGVLDFSLHLVNEDLIIIDHKSGQPNTDISKYDAQLRSYAVAGRILYPTVRGVLSAINWLRSGEVVWGTFVPVSTIDNEYFDWFETYINSFVSNVEPTPKKGFYCGFCGFQPRCPLFAGGK